MTSTQIVKKSKKTVMPLKKNTAILKKNTALSALDSLANLPPTIHGKGYTIVNANSADRAEVLIEKDEAAAALYSWNSSCFPWSLVSRLRVDKQPVALPISHFITQHNFQAMEHGFSDLYKQLSNLISARKDLIQTLVSNNGVIPFDLLPEVLHAFVNKYAVFHVDGEDYYAQLKDVRQMSNTFSGMRLHVNFTKFVWDEGKLKPIVDSLVLRPDAKMRTLLEWGITVSPTPEKLEALLARGNKTIELNEKCAYVQVSGNLTYRVAWFERQAPATGRAIVDRAGHAIFNPNERDDFDDRDGTEIKVSEASTDEIRAVSPWLTVFSFVAKKWGKVNVTQASDIVFRNDSFEKLVLPLEDKRLVHTLVKNSDASLTSDLVDGKGGGCVLLLHGKPGLGKTLTAEAVAETLKRPLYAVSVGELGTNPETLEEKLQTVLQTAQRWNAVLLLDEADVFLEARKSGDIDRNAMVGTFLRLLEYYNGVLILTTNRVEDMDKAFYSRISLALRYNDFAVNTRQQVVENLLAVNGVQLTPDAIKEIAGRDANGRQIKNSIRIARFMAKDEARAVCVEDIINVLNKLQDFQNSFNTKS